MHQPECTGRGVLEQTNVTHWIDSGGDEPRLHGRPIDDVGCEASPRRAGNPARSSRAVKLGCALLLVVLAAPFGHARDRGQFVNTNADLKAWFDGLRSGKGPCCPDADGSEISDSDWESKDGHYRVRVPRYGYHPDNQPQDLIWVEVPDDAVISEPNRVGRTMVWPIYGYLGVSIRCFMPGSMT